MPFAPSSSDVLQATIRCNADYQYQKRCVPECNFSQQEAKAGTAKEHAGASVATEHADPPSFLVHGCRRLRQALVGSILATLATAMRAASVADFYMTKYQSTSQEQLGSIMQPFIAGMRRIEEEEATGARGAACHTL